jgi:spore coat polysaccharide biosynthesis protein SpsF (cytidylyltransferase family)
MIVVIIQARMNSSRLPGKVMQKVLGKPLIAYLLERVSQAKTIDRIVLATTNKHEDDILADFVSSLGYLVFRGSEKDVLARYYNAFQCFKDEQDDVNAIVRITGDCPLIEPDLIDKVVNKYLEEKLDYVALESTFPEGLDVEIFSSTMLECAFNKAKLLSEREHVALYFHNNSHLYNMSRVKNQTDDSKYRITVDEPEDFMVVKAIIENFSKNNLVMNTKNIKDFLDNNSSIYNLNANIIRNEGLQKSLEKESVEDGI